MAKFIERVWACDTMTGARLGIIPASSFTYTRVANDGGSGQMVLNVREKVASRLDLPSLLQEDRTTLVYESDGQVIAAGIMGEPDYDRDSGTLAIEHSDLWSMLETRKAIKHGVPDAMLAHLVYGPLSLNTIAKRLFQEAVAPGSQYRLPLNLPPEEAGTEKRTWFGYNMGSIADALRELMAADGGPDVDVQPRWADNGLLEWAPRIGNIDTFIPREWNLDAPGGGLTQVGVKRDPSGVTTNAYIIGEGSEKKTRYRSNPSPDQTYPARERDTAYKTVSNLNELGALAIGRTKTYAKPTQQWRISINKDGIGEYQSPRVNQLRLGDRVRIYTAGDPWIPAGWSEHRLIKFSGALESQLVKLEFQPTGA